jgi:hypothetical protein
VVSALPWTMPASKAEIGSPGGSGDSWRSVWPGGGGAVPDGKVADGCALCGIDGEWADDDEGSVPLDIGGEWA